MDCGEAPEEDVPDESGIGVHDGALEDDTGEGLFEFVDEI